ncbi:COX15/CtaA family protein [Sporosarcina sp. YIM B06819]|uniref:COX15/CtaA family protein n=1 Tax=Sporosarcina sp. YIM B06819 TaxID=3081769 RepID=UPI00298CE471|nr:COX15/CtaA family protein [Sporosarcina sp. YIM B06819]
MSIKRLALLTAVITFGLIVFGGYVASSQSGMGCGPEWPLCNGKVIPNLQGDTLIEFAHRVIGAVLGILTIILFVKVVRAKMEHTVRRAAYWMVALLALQVVLGAIIVWYHLPTFIIAGHLIIAMLFLACVLVICRRSTKPGRHRIALSNQQQKKITRHIKVLLGLVLLILFVGAYVKHDFIGTSCGWATCGDSVMPSTGPEQIQTIHRMLGVILAVYSLLLTYWSFAKGWGASFQKRFSFISVTIAVQIVLGILTIVTAIDIVWAMLHVVVGTLLFAIVAEANIFMATLAKEKGRIVPFVIKQLPMKNGKSGSYSGQR